VLWWNEIRDVISVIIQYICNEVRMLKYVGYAGQVVVKWPDFWPPDPLVIEVCPRPIYDARMAERAGIMRKTMNHQPVHTLAKGLVCVWFKVCRSFLPIPIAGECFFLYDGFLINMGCCRNFLYQPYHVYPVFIIIRTFIPEFTPGNIQRTQRF